MSVRAYKITKMEYNQDDTFNLWHDTEINDWLEQGGYYEGFDGNGILELQVASVKELIDYLKKVDKTKLKKDEMYKTWIIPQLQKDIKGLDDNDFISYMCF